MSYLLGAAVLLTVLAFGGCAAYAVALGRWEDDCLERNGLDDRPTGDSTGMCDPTP